MERPVPRLPSNSVMPTQIFGIRHHGPGSARSLLQSLEAMRPDVILVEGPPDADSLMSFVSHEQMQPPVALLIYVPDEPRRSAFYPFAEFSPEWQAIRYGVGSGIPVRFMDLPQAHQLAIEAEHEVKPGQLLPNEVANVPDEGKKETPVSQSPSLVIRRDPLQWAAMAAGYCDSERWWEQMVELRGDRTAPAAESSIFLAVMELMRALREVTPRDEMGDESYHTNEFRREAWMRQTIRAAKRDGFENIAVVCGAWHAPALENLGPAKQDSELLKGLPRVKTAATWAPWTYSRFSFDSGYGAGIESPGYYEQLWNHPVNVAPYWISRCAALLREQDLDASPAAIIEAVRLSETLAALRGLPVPGLSELMEAVLSVLCGGNGHSVELISRKLIVGEQLGQVPDETPMPPLQRDLNIEQKRLRLVPEAIDRALDLDLRKPNDLERSRLLHRLDLLGIPWGERQQEVGPKGSTFHERWKLQWRPEFAVNVIEACIWGNTVTSAAEQKVAQAALDSSDLSALTSLLERTMLADLPASVALLMNRLENIAGITSDIPHLMEAVPPLAAVMRYGNVRGTDSGLVQNVLFGLITRICIGIIPACSALNDEAGAAMYGRIVGLSSSIALLQDEELTQNWRSALEKLAVGSGIHGLVAGRSCRLLLDQSIWSQEEAGRHLNLALSRASAPIDAAAWVEGFLKGSGLLLLHSDTLWTIIDAWVASLNEDTFTLLLPVVRRTFATFPHAERRQMGERAKQAGRSVAHGAPEESAHIDTERAAIVLPVLAQILGLDLRKQELLS